MKKTANRLCKLLGLIVICFILTECVNEDTITSSKQETQKSAIRTRLIAFDDIQSMPGVMQRIQDLQSLQQSNLNQKLIENKQFNFSVNTDNVLLLETNDYHSLSFSISRDTPVPDDTIENLFLHPYKGSYLSYIIQYKLSYDNLQNLNNGKRLDMNGIKLTIIPLDHEASTLDVGDPFCHNGVCSKYDKTIRSSDGSVLGMTIVPCGNCICPEECSSSSSGTPVLPSGGGGYQFIDIRTFYVPKVGTIVNTPFNPSHGQAGGGGSTTPGNLPNIPYPDKGIIGTLNPANVMDGEPIIGLNTQDPESDEKNCDELKKLLANQAIKNSLNDLKNKTEGHREYGYIFKDNVSPTPTTVGADGSTTKVPYGGSIYGYSHTHYPGLFPMFSLSDITQLGLIASLYTGTPVGQRKNYNKFVATLTVNFGGEDRTFAVKITDNMQFMPYCTAYFNYNKATQKYLADMLTNEYIKVKDKGLDIEGYIISLLKFLKKQNFNGIAIYEAENNFTGWNKLSLDPNNNNNTLISKSCN